MSIQNLNLSRLKDYRDEILKVEIGSLLFNLGKTHIGFWKEKKEKNKKLTYFNVDDFSFEKIFGFKVFTSYKHYYKNDKSNERNKSPFEIELEKFKLKEFIYSQKVNLPFKNKEIQWKEFFKGNASKDNDFKDIKNIFIRGCENINSGIDKGSPNKQLKPPLWSSNPFGTFKRKIEEKDFDKKRQCFFDALNDFLEENNYKNEPDWRSIRNFILKKIRNWYLKLLSDSRFPINDVTLWDQAYMTSTMFKAALAGMILDETNRKYEEYKENPNRIKWSILGIQYDKLGLTEKPLKVRGIHWYREACKSVDNEIKRLIEINYVLGNEIYRDETGIYFLVPENIIGDSFFDDGKLYELHSDLEELKREILKVFKKKFNDEIYPAIVLTKPSRGLMNLGYLLEKAKDNFLKADLSMKNIDLNLELSNGRKAKQICQICEARFVFDDEEKEEDFKNYCDICYKRVKGRLKHWYKNRNKETIWINELKDKNNRIALITLKFELKEWLNGNMLNSLLVNLNEFNIYFLTIKNFILNLSYLCKSSKLLIREVEYLCKKLKNKLKNKYLPKDLKEIYGKFIGNLKSFTNDLKEYDYIADKKLNLVSKEKNNLESELQDFQNKLKDLNGGNKLNNEYELNNELYGIYNKLKSFLDKLRRIQNGINIFSDISRDAIEGCSRNEESFNDFIRQIFFGSIVGTEWEEFIKNTPLNSKIDWNNEKIKWEEFTNENDPALDILSKLLLQFLLRKNPSPARLRRVWESTKEFFENLERKIMELADIPNWRRKRIVLEISENLEEGEYKCGDLLFYVSKYEPNKLYLITSIEDFLFKFSDNEIKSLLKDKAQNTEKLNEILNDKDKLKSKLNISNIEKIINSEIRDIKIEIYKPYFSIIEPTPVSWQFIIPAEHLPNLIKKIEKEYLKYFKWVYGKLPLHIGAIIQKHKKPLYIALKALRRIRRDNVKWKDLRKEISEKELKVIQKNIYSNYVKNEELENNTEKYYSLYELQDSNGDYEFYIYPENDGKYFISIIKEDGSRRFYYYPNTFDFEYLDANIRRNDIFYIKGKRALNIKSNRPYNLENFTKFQIFKDTFKNSSTKLQKLVELLFSNQDKIENLNIYKKFLLSLFINTLELGKRKDILKNLSQILFEEELVSLHNFKKKFLDNISKEKIYMLLDMYEFWHVALKEI